MPQRSAATAARALCAAVLLALALVSGCSTVAGTPPPAATAQADVGAVDEGATGVSDAEAVSSPPIRIDVPAIEVSSDLMGLGLQQDGTMEVPPGAFPAGWYTGSPTPGAMGPSVIAGHVDWNGAPGVFSRLGDLTSDDDVIVTLQDGTTSRFRVTQVEQYPKAEFPTTTVYGDIDHPGLRLITCGGLFDSGAASYDDNIVVYADLIS
ncbi:class F sortase [Rhodococcus sp. BP-349]|uniref:class F sortase n=1 Tax=unclassified Rhodococcus (in: high G+C Gram-positive bacteria) TaxID=192944 RepID=UPI001C9AF87B|nr:MULTISPECIES: class F sortase [unclassified Rhodococcus (in: high G+C Gram-positive bacteria)]MBY6538458.1 class F sortase [Rhodococcus sp. BP-363]MBY6542795.1 class F sortase [Rhodococcus sp. BP-369]MBY6562025.1 class F sortase [Rhodococcus sp. BP-370]MBY6576317.1 class F sortase [Rhodococcus sp. BP-364]MBY6585618.1 class F sortase [Rhodococcus sp. BP-358]